MTYKPSGPNDSTHGREGRKGEEGGERGDGGRGWIVGMSCIKRESGGGDSSWTLEGLSEAMDSRKRRGWVGGGRGRDVTHARGTVNASAIRQMHETPPPYFECTKFPRLLFSISPTLPSPLPPAHGCNPPMLNATFASPPIYIRPHVSLPLPLLMNHLSVLSFLVRLVPTFRFPICFLSH